MKFILILFVIALFIVAVTAFVLFRKFRDIASRFRSQMGGSNFTDGSRQRTSRQTFTPNGDIILDNRTPEQANRKIYAKDEGEYVDYKEK